MSDPEPDPTSGETKASSMPGPEPLAIDADDLYDFVHRYEDQEDSTKSADDGPDIRSDAQPPS